MVRRAAGLDAIPAAELSEGDLLVREDLSSTSVLSVEPAGRGRVVVVTTTASHLFFAGDDPVLGHNVTHGSKSPQGSTNTVNGAMAGMGSGTGTGG